MQISACGIPFYARSYIGYRNDESIGNYPLSCNLNKKQSEECIVIPPPIRLLLARIYFCFGL